MIQPLIRRFVLIAVVFAGRLTLGGETIYRLLEEYCVDCHTGTAPSGQFSIEGLLKLDSAEESISRERVSWERIIRRLRAGQMPPPQQPRPDRSHLAEIVKDLGRALEASDESRPFYGTTPGIRRLTRIEYQNAIRDLLGLRIDAATYLPKDESSHGFDNITTGELTPTFISRAVQAAESISRQVLGIEELGPAGITIRIPPDRTQESRIEGLPHGTRGGIAFDYHFPSSGKYEFQMRLTRDRDEKVEGLGEGAELDVLIDREPRHRFSIRKPDRSDDHTLVDKNLRVRLDVDAGTHRIGVTFPQQGESLLEIKRQPFDASYNRHRHPRPHVALYEVSIVGPIEIRSKGVPSNPITRKLFDDLPLEPPADQQRAVARQVLLRLARLAYRRPASDKDIEISLSMYDHASSNGGFLFGLEAGIASILVNPNFLLRVESSSDDSPGQPVTLSPLELASRLSFFLWSSIPDDELLKTAENGRINQPEVLAEQVDRMLRDPKSEALVNNFASQWLYLRNLSSLAPDLRLYPDFDDNLRHAFREETEHFFREVIRENHSVLSLIRSNHTYLNERLAIHYDVPGILGSEFRRVALDPANQRGGLLRQASVLSVTSYATRTSPTIRGNWILENMIGTPPPPPPPNVPALQEKKDSSPSTTRERLAMHRSNPNCASCHDLMDPIGFALENYDALGRWRNWDSDLAVDPEGVLPDGTVAHSVVDLEDSLLKRPEVFVGTLVEKLMTYGLGRGVELEDGPQIRTIVQNASGQEYRFASIIHGIVKSRPFQTRLVR